MTPATSQPEKSSGLMTEISKPQQENHQSSITNKETAQNKFSRGDLKNRKEVKMEQGSSGTFNNSRAEEFDGYAPDDTMISNNSHETTMEDGGNEKQMLAELIQSDQ